MISAAAVRAPPAKTGSREIVVMALIVIRVSRASQDRLSHSGRGDQDDARDERDAGESGETVADNRHGRRPITLSYVLEQFEVIASKYQIEKGILMTRLGYLRDERKLLDSATLMCRTGVRRAVPRARLTAQRPEREGAAAGMFRLALRPDAATEARATRSPGATE